LCKKPEVKSNAMKLEDASATLQELGQHLFDFIERLTGVRPYWFINKYYKAESNGKAFLWIHFYGERAQGDHKNAIGLNTRLVESQDGDSEEAGNEFHGLASKELPVRPELPEEFAQAKKFIREAMKSRPNW
jgi:hypothetical protein